MKEVLTMLNTIRAIVDEGRIELLDPAELPEGTPLLITVLAADEAVFWRGASQPALAEVWDNDEDDGYGARVALPCISQRSIT